MKYEVLLDARAKKDLKALPVRDAEKVMKRMLGLEHDLAGDVKRLTNFSPSYRLRVGDWRVLFEVEGSAVVVYRILHRRESYR